MVLGLGAVTSLDIISVGIDSDNCGGVDYDQSEQIRRQQMTNKEKLKEVFPKNIFIQRKEEDKTVALMVSDEWLEAEYIDPSHEEKED